MGYGKRPPVLMYDSAYTHPHLLTDVATALWSPFPDISLSVP